MYLPGLALFLLSVELLPPFVLLVQSVYMQTYETYRYHILICMPGLLKVPSNGRMQSIQLEYIGQ